MPTRKIAYILSRFPVLTETFITGEIEELRRRETDVQVFSLKGPRRDEVFHGNTEKLINTTHYFPYLFSLVIWEGLFFYMRTKPGTCFDIFRKIFRTHIRNPLQLLKTLAVVPKTFAIAMTLKKSGITKVHAHWATIPATTAWIAAKLNGITFTFTAHAWDIFEVDTMLKEKMQDARKIVTISEYNKKYLHEKFPSIDSNKIVVIHCGVDLGKFSPYQSIEESTFRILSVGRLTEKKGFDVLLHACRLLKERGIPILCRIVYVSGNYEYEIFRLYKQLDLIETVQFIPELPQEEIIKQYLNADCFVLPCVIAGSSDRDGIPVVILEALAMELPVVTTSVSGIPEVIKDNETGLLVSPQNAEELANAIERIYSDTELRKKLRKAGRDVVHEQFEISSCVSRLLSTIFN